MIKTYKKGSIVPRHIARTTDRKSQHKIRFGCDVKVVGYKSAVAASEGSFIVIMKVGRVMNNLTFKPCGVVIEGIINFTGYQPLKSYNKMPEVNLIIKKMEKEI